MKYNLHFVVREGGAIASAIVDAIFPPQDSSFARLGSMSFPNETEQDCIPPEEANQKYQW